MQHLQDSFDGFTVMMTLQHGENGGYITYFKEYPTVSAFAEEPKDAIEALATVWATIKESVEASKSLPIAPSRQNLGAEDSNGKIKDLEIEPRLHFILKLEAKRDNVPLDTLINRKLKVLADWTLAD